MEQAQQANTETDRVRKAQTATYKVMYALAGHLAGYEEALRALYSGEAEYFEALIVSWPADVTMNVRRLAAAAL